MTDTIETESTNVRKMRETIDRQAEELAELRQFRQDRIIKDSGLTGPALKAVLKDIERGDYSDGWTPEAVQKYAEKEYDWSPQPAEPKAESSAPDPMQQLVDEGEAQLDELERNGTAPPLKDIASATNEAQAKGDFATAIRLGVASQVDQMLGLSKQQE